MHQSISSSAPPTRCREGTTILRREQKDVETGDIFRTNTGYLSASQEGDERCQWQSAAVTVGMGSNIREESTGKQTYSGITPHDMRRSGIRNLIKAAVSEAVGMPISGHSLPKRSALAKSRI